MSRRSLGIASGGVDIIAQDAKKWTLKYEADSPLLILSPHTPVG
jgi:hypothetical protein